MYSQNDRVISACSMSGLAVSVSEHIFLLVSCLYPVTIASWIRTSPANLFVVCYLRYALVVLLLVIMYVQCTCITISKV